MLSYVTGTVNQELLLRNEYLGAENRILRRQIKGRLQLSEGEKGTLAEIPAARTESLGMPRGRKLSRRREKPIACHPLPNSSEVRDALDEQFTQDPTTVFLL